MPPDETERLRTLRGLKVLDTDPEAGYDIFAHSARSVANTEIATLTLIDDTRQFLKAAVGLPFRETSRDDAFCAYAILADEIFCVEDAALDDRFRDNPLVTGGPRIRAYAGAQIRVDGHAVGTVCAISTRPQQFPEHVRRALEQIAEAAADRMRMGRQLEVQSRLLQSTSDAVVTADPSGRITYWNRAAERIFGYSAAQAATMSIDDLAPERLRMRHRAGMARLQAGGPSRLEGKPVELPALHCAGHEVPVELTLSLWRDGADWGYGAILRDCSERKELEEARAFSQAADRFLANMSHEIRTPLNGLLGLAQALERTQLDPEQAEIVRLMETSGFALQRVLSDVLDSARLRDGSPEIASEPCDLSLVLRNVTASHAQNALQKGLAYEVELPSEPTWVTTDSGRLTQIVSNLVSNAIKFTAEGSVRFVAREAEADLWGFDVYDTGIGFAPEAATRIFERFRQEDETITRRFGGSGLGLSISRDLARALGGEIEARPLPEGGSVFALTLPLTRCAAPAVDTPPTGAGGGGVADAARPLRVLLAEDHEINRKVVELLLGPTCADLTMVENGALAVEAFRRAPFDVVLMDLHMPVMDGLTAITAIRSHEQAIGLAPCRIVTLTANAFDDHVRAALSAGADDHLAKPVTASALLASLYATDEVRGCYDLRFELSA